jgi:hypothetical protein
VVLGEAGYGKTVAALTLLAHVNGSGGDARPPVAELFSLGEWYGWAADHPDRPLAEWLAAALATSYPPLDGTTAGALLDHQLVLPILDGLDEVPERHRRACIDAIDAHAGVTEPFRPFVLTYRSVDGESPGPDLMRSDRTVRLVGLSKLGVADVIEDRAARHPAWTTIRDRLGTDDASLAELLGSPLRLSLALQAYEQGGAEGSSSTFAMPGDGRPAQVRDATADHTPPGTRRGPGLAGASDLLVVLAPPTGFQEQGNGAEGGRAMATRGSDRRQLVLEVCRPLPPSRTSLHPGLMSRRG